MASIVLLRRVARAIGVPLAQLVQDGPEPPIELTLLDAISRAAAGRADRATCARSSPSTWSPQQRRRRCPPRRIALIGLRGAGKSTPGACSRSNSALPFIELDREIERRSGASLSELFDMFGQPTSAAPSARRSRTCSRASSGFVIATSGSIVTEPATLERLLSACRTVWVKAEPTEHMAARHEQGDMRPMATARARWKT